MWPHATVLMLISIQCSPPQLVNLPCLEIVFFYLFAVVHVCCLQYVAAVEEWLYSTATSLATYADLATLQDRMVQVRHTQDKDEDSTVEDDVM